MNVAPHNNIQRITDTVVLTLKGGMFAIDAADLIELERRKARKVGLQLYVRGASSGNIELFTRDRR